MTTERVKKNIFAFFSVIFLLIGITATFPHRLYKSSLHNPEISLINKERSVLKKYWNNKEYLHDSLFKNNLISKDFYFEEKLDNEKNRILAFRKISKKRKKAANDFSFNGRSSKNHWLWVFGVLVSLLTSSIFLVLKDSRLLKAGLLKWYEPHASVGFISVTLFWLYHTIFKKTNDFVLSVYTLYLFCVLVPISYFIYHFIRRTFVIETKHEENIQELVQHVLNKTKPENENEKWELLEKIANNGK